MFDNLLNLVKEHAGDAIINNPAIPNEKNNEAIHSTTSSIVDTLKAQVASGNLSSITDLLKGGNINSSSIGNALHSNVVSDLMKKFGVDNTQATTIASSILPKVMEQFVSKTNDPNDSSFDLNGIMNSLGGDNTSGILGKITGLFN
jgi:hypothetical protein